MALAFGMDHIVVDRGRPTDPAASVYLSNTAITRGKPALTIESGGMAEIDTDDILRIERGVAGLLKHLKMRSEGPDPIVAPVMLERSAVLTSNSTGIFYAAVQKGQTVAEGAVIGRINTRSRRSDPRSRPIACHECPARMTRTQPQARQRSRST
jgi:predicted deacylase